MGSAVALVVVQFARCITHEVALRLTFSPGLLSGMDRLEMVVSESADESAVYSAVAFRIDAPLEALHHVLRLPSGKYLVYVKLLSAGVPRREFWHNLEVSGEATASIHLR